MKIPEDITPPELIERVKSLFGVTFTDHMGAEHTAFDYHHGQVFHVRDKCQAPECNGTVSSWSAEGYIRMYEEYLNRIKVKEENNVEQFIKDNGIVAMITNTSREADSSYIFESTNIKTLTEGGRGGMFAGIFDASFFGKAIEIGPSYGHSSNSHGVEFKFNEHVNENYWTLERDSSTESGYESTCRDQDWTGINKFNHRHLTAKTVDDVFNKAVDDVFDAIRKKHCIGAKIGVNKAGTKFMLPTNHVCETWDCRKPVDPNDEYVYSISFSHMHSKTRYTRGYGDTQAIPKAATYITEDEFIKALRELFDKEARPLYEFTKKNIGVK